MNKSINKTELIHIRIEPDVKVQSENIFKRFCSIFGAIFLFSREVIRFLKLIGFSNQEIEKLENLNNEINI